MKQILTILNLLILLSGVAHCKKPNDDKNKNGIFLFGILLSQTAGSCNPQSGFTICIPKGIAE